MENIGMEIARRHMGGEHCPACERGHAGDVEILARDINQAIENAVENAKHDDAWEE